MLDLTIVVPFLNQKELVETTLQLLVENKTNHTTRIIALDNGSEQSISFDESVDYVRFDENIGNYPVFRELLGLSKSSVIGVLHSDVAVHERGYDDRILNTFEQNQQLGLLGFLGSNEIDIAGGRGLGTASNFMGKTITNAETGKTWIGSPAEPHGRRVTGYEKGAVVDGLAMIFRRKALEEMQFKSSFPVHHFYDKLMSSQMLEKNWHVGILGIACDHFSGQTVAHEAKYHALAMQWCIERGIQPGENNNWDLAIYREAERQWLSEYRDQKHLIPIKVS